MEELLDKIDNLKESLNKEETILVIRELNKKIKLDNKLLKLIEDYNNKPSKELKNEIYNNELYRKYKESETDINLLIMSINSKLKEISNRGKCS